MLSPLFRNFDASKHFKPRYGISRVVRNQSSSKLWRDHGRQWSLRILAVFSCVALSGCESGFIDVMPQGARTDRRFAYITGDEPQAVLAARDTLAAGGTAADAAVTMGFALSVTLQSSAGIGGGGVCLVFDTESRETQALDFLPVPANGNSAVARWQVSIPALPRGMYALHAKYGQLPWASVISPTEAIVRFRHTVARALANDLQHYSDALVSDPSALDVFMSSDRKMLREGARVRQLDLAATLGLLRGRTPADFYTGVTATMIDDSARVSGLSLSAQDLRAYTPVWRSPGELDFDGTKVYFVGSTETARELEARLRSGSKAAGEQPPPPRSRPGASGYVVADRYGNVVACSLTMLTPFGTGVMPDGLGFLTAPSPDFLRGPVAEPIAALAVSKARSSVEFAGASGGPSAGRELASTLAAKTEAGEAGAHTGRSEGQRPFVNYIHCPASTPTKANCTTESDPVGFGFALVVRGD